MAEAIFEPPRRAGNQVVIAMDGSLHSRHAFEWYVENLHCKGDKVILVHCPEYKSLLNSPYLTTDPSKASDLANEEEKKVKSMFTEWKEDIKNAKIDGSIIRTSGDPGRAIIKIARGEGADYIVTGSRGLGALRKTFMGSISDYIVHHAHIPVIVVRNRDDDQK